MDDYRNVILGAEPGQIVPIVKEIDIDEPVDFFARLSDYGRAKNCCLLEASDHLSENALSFGTARPALYLTGTGADFTIKALSPTGKRMLDFFSAQKDRFAFCESIKFCPEEITGRIRQDEKLVDEQSRLRSTNQMDVLRAVAFSFSLASKPFRVTCGLFGALSYDFIDQFEKLPASETDLLVNPDYEFYFADNIFLMDHERGKSYVIVNCIITDGDREAAIREAQSSFDYYFNIARFEPPKGKKFTGELPEATTDTDQAEYEQMVKKAKRHILDGDIFQVVLSRTKLEPCPDEPLDVYKRLRRLNPSPYLQVSVFVDTAGTSKFSGQVLSDLIRKLFPLTPKKMIEHLKLARPIFSQTSYGGHFGRKGDGFTWEQTDMAAKLRKAAGL